MDLIPEEYRERQRVEALLRSFLWVCVAAVLLLGAARLGLGVLIQREGPLHERYLQLDAASRSQRESIAALQARKTDVELRSRILESLRGAADVAPLFATVDQALTGSVWFQEMTFTRDGNLVPVKPEAVQSGYFIVVPKDGAAGNPQAGEQAWRTQKHMEIRGIAVDHGALAEFMKGLESQPGLSSVRLLSTGTRNYTTTQVVEFSLAALLTGEAR